MKTMHAIDWFMALGPLALTAMLVDMDMLVITPLSLFMFAITGGGALMGYRWR